MSDKIEHSFFSQPFNRKVLVHIQRSALELLTLIGINIEIIRIRLKRIRVRIRRRSSIQKHKSKAGGILQFYIFITLIILQSCLPIRSFTIGIVWMRLSPPIKIPTIKKQSLAIIPIILDRKIIGICSTIFKLFPASKSTSRSCRTHKIRIVMKIQMTFS